MENVLLARVDDRLIHGQVMTAWMKLLPAKEIIVIDNKVAKDESQYLKWQHQLA